MQHGEAEIDPREASTIQLSDLSARVRIGRFGPFVEMGTDEEVVTASIPDGTAPADLSGETVEALVRAKAEGPTSLGKDPDTGLPVLLLIGPFGPYVQRGETPENGKKPKRVSLPKGMEPDGVTLEAALQLLALPRTLGTHPESGKPVQAGIGRYGPYVVHDGDFRSLSAGEDVLTVELPRALELLAQPKGRRRSAAKPLREIGPHPENGEPIAVYQGRYGPYVKHGDLNASLPRGVAPEEVTMDQALELLAARKSRASGKGGKKGKSGGRKKTSRASKAGKKS